MPGWARGEGSWQAELRGRCKGDKRSPWVDFRELSRTGGQYTAVLRLEVCLVAGVPSEA